MGVEMPVSYGRPKYPILNYKLCFHISTITIIHGHLPALTSLGNQMQVPTRGSQGFYYPLNFKTCPNLSCLSSRGFKEPVPYGKPHFIYI